MSGCMEAWRDTLGISSRGVLFSSRLDACVLADILREIAIGKLMGIERSRNR